MYQTFLCSYNKLVRIRVYTFVVDELNKQFLNLIKNVPHSYEKLLTHLDIADFVEDSIHLKFYKDTLIEVDHKFFDKYYKKFEVIYYLEKTYDFEHGELMLPTAEAELYYGNTKNLDSFYMDNGFW
jgi:hypothetical protein